VVSHCKVIFLLFFITFLFTEVPIQLLIGLRSETQPIVVDVEQRPVLEARAARDIFNNLTVLDDHLSTCTFVVGEKITLADVSLFAAYSAALQVGAVDASLLPSLFRWYMTVGSMPKVKAVFGPIAPTQETMPVVKKVAGPAGAGGKWDRHRIRVKELIQQGEAAIGSEVVLKGWVRTLRSAEKGAVLFVELTDGSSVRGMQVVFNAATTSGMKEVAEAGGAGSSFSVRGVVVASPAKGQAIEVHAKEAAVFGAVYGGDKGEVGGKNYPMAKKMHTLEFLREKAHLRPRSKVFSSALRVRHAMAFATNKVEKLTVYIGFILLLHEFYFVSVRVVLRVVLQRPRVRVRAHPADHGCRLRRCR
jgi:hypothetical protein